VIAIAAGRGVSLALKADGTVIGWGAYYIPLGGGFPVQVPEGLTNVVAVSAGDGLFSLALNSDGRVVAFGDPLYGNFEGQMNVPASLTNVVAIAAGGNHNLVLIGDGRPFLTSPLVNRTSAYGETIFLRITATGAWPLSYQWKFNGADLPNATDGLLALSAVKYGQAGTYSVVLTDRLGQTTGAEMSLAVVPLLSHRSAARPDHIPGRNGGIPRIRRR